MSSDTMIDRHNVTPYLLINEASKCIDFLKTVFSLRRVDYGESVEGFFYNTHLGILIVPSIFLPTDFAAERALFARIFPFYDRQNQQNCFG